MDIGPLVNNSGTDKVIDHVNDAISKGASILCGGKVSDNKNVYFYQPTVLDNVTKNMKIMNEETFRTVAPLTIFDSEKEVIFAVNNTDYGLASYIYTNDITRAVRVSEALNFGIVGLNDGLPSAEHRRHLVE